MVENKFYKIKSKISQFRNSEILILLVRNPKNILKASLILYLNIKLNYFYNHLNLVKVYFISSSEKIFKSFYNYLISKLFSKFLIL